MDSIDRLVDRDRVDALLRVLPLTLASNTFVSVSFTVTMWGDVQPASLLCFVTLNAAVNLGRLWGVWTVRRRGLTELSPSLVLTLSRAGALVSGLCWAMILVLAAQAGHAYNLAVGLTFCGINAGSVIQSTADRQTTLAFVLPNSVILILTLLAGETVQSQIIGVNLLLLTLLMVRASTRAERDYVTAARLRHEAAHLADSLRQANVAATQAMQRLEHAASHDPLTGLFNRAAYRTRLAERMARAGSGEGEVSLLLIDLDGFKGINDTYGHAAGDAVLAEVARRLTAVLGPDEVIARLGGDEFAALLFRDRIGEADELAAERIVRSLCAPFVLEERFMEAGASVGIARFPRDAATAQDLQAAADLALYASKSGGRGRWCAFGEALRHPSQGGSAGGRGARALGSDLARALESGSVEVWFQPQVDAPTGRTCGLEALLRWTHPAFGPVPPPEAVRAAAAAGLTPALTRHVVREACRMAVRLDAAGRDDVVIAVNVSPEAFGIDLVPRMVADELAAHGVEGRRLEVEITEQVPYGAERVGAEIAALRASGVAIVIDDFGMAYASLEALRGIDFDGLKIDRAFVSGLATGERDRAMIQAILAFARSLGVRTVAEGVETAAQAAILRQLGCPVLQGYRYAPALPPTQALFWIARNAVEPALGDEPAPGVSAPGRLAAAE
ncbi:putative bifunctional diguanylate cyclase/phosphodiesterase [Methylobacterium oryzisoli]|uniref:putative bifunctional diguanylate cyclase/phosphodiesterase n=1 Tax=Methylobacterium oryzisoli TaxID=3385502 RepID=UPI003891A1B6